MGMVFKRIVARMFEDEDTVIGKKIIREDEVWQCFETVDGIGWVGKNDIKLSGGTFQKVKDIRTNHMHIIDGKPRNLRFNIIGTGVTDIYRGYFAHSSRDKFKRNSSGASEKVHDRALFKIDIIIEDIEKTLASHVRGWADRQVDRRIKTSASEISCNDSHKISAFR